MIRVAQCWDDGVATDIRLTGIFRAYGAKATFNLNPGFLPETTTQDRWAAPREPNWSHKGLIRGHVGIDALRRVYSGFQVASHCWKHEVATTVPTQEFLDAAVRARTFLEETFQQECPGFAYPCGRTDEAAIAALAGAGFAYARTTENTDHLPEALRTPLRLASNCHFQSPDFWRKFDAAKAAGEDFYFWGHSYEMLDSPGMWGQLEDKIRVLTEDPDVEWADVIDLVR